MTGATPWWRASCVRQRTSASPRAACAPAPARIFPACGSAATGCAPAPRAAACRALRLGVADDAVFGPVIYLGEAAAANGALRGGPAAAQPAPGDGPGGARRLCRDASEEERDALETELATALVRLSQLLTDIDEVTAIELDPIHVETTGVVARERRIHVERRGRRSASAASPSAPTPRNWNSISTGTGRKLLIRPIRPEDEPRWPT
jgi:acetyltransferase